MPLIKLFSASVIGMEASLAPVEVDFSRGMPALNIVGLPDPMIRESRERIRAAIKNSGFDFPLANITVNLSPAHLKKSGSFFDLPIALGIMLAKDWPNICKGKPDRAKLIQETLFIGELSLDGKIVSSRGVLLAALLTQKEQLSNLVLSSANANEAKLADGVNIWPQNNLGECLGWLKGLAEAIPYQTLLSQAPIPRRKFGLDFSEVKGQQLAKRALEIAATGNHNVLMIGSPGSGKSMLAQRIQTILPPLSEDKKLEVLKIHSAAGQLGDYCTDSVDEGYQSIPRPFRSPHHASSAAGIIGGLNGMPGEISLAHGGILFLDELPEYDRRVLESLREPLEAKKISLARIGKKFNYPADFILIAAMNPCQCGYFGDSVKSCSCTEYQRQKYLSRISGPMLDRIDLVVNVGRLSGDELSAIPTGETSEAIHSRVVRAIDFRRNRKLGDEKILSKEDNHQSENRENTLSLSAKKLLSLAVTKFDLTGRSYQKTLEVSRTIADLSQSGFIEESHVAEALQYRASSLQFDLFG